MNTITLTFEKEVAIMSKVLFELDPAGTCCKENDCFDEYDNTAMFIVSYEHEKYHVNGVKSENNAISKTFLELHYLDLTCEKLTSISEEFNNAKNVATEKIS